MNLFKIFMQTLTFIDQFRYELLAMLFVLLLVDWLQTSIVARNPTRYYEENPFLGKHPTPSQVNRWFAFNIFFAALGFGLFLFAGLWPIVIVVSVIYTLMEIRCVVGNFLIGLKP